MKAILISILVMSSQFIYCQSEDKAIALNEAGGAIMTLMEEYPEFNTKESFNSALSYLEHAESENPENKDVINNLGMLYYNWCLSLAKKSDSDEISNEEFMAIQDEMTAYGEKATFYLQKHASLSQ